MRPHEEGYICFMAWAFEGGNRDNALTSWLRCRKMREAGDNFLAAV